MIKLNKYIKVLQSMTGKCLTVSSPNRSIQGSLWGPSKETDLRKAAHEVSQSLWVRTLQLLDYLKALV